MKYLKLFEDIEDNEEIKKVIEEICYDITDDGFIVRQREDSFFSEMSNQDYLTKQKMKEIAGESVNFIQIYKNDQIDKFMFSEIKETVERIKVYLGDRLYYSMINYNDKWVCDSYDKVNITMVLILYR